MPNNGEMINYTYTASGAKVRQQLEAGGKGGISTRRDYAGPFVFVNNAPGWVGTPHGRFVLDGTWKNEFHLRDHLGNTRIALLESGSDSLAILQQNHYYPFGMVMNQTNPGTSPKNKLLYNSKEIQDDVVAGKKLDWYDYGARFYDPQLARWHSVDPLAEIGRRWSPYTYAFNNPILFIDPDGMWPICENCDDIYAKGARVTNRWGTWAYQGNNIWYNFRTKKYQSSKSLKNTAEHAVEARSNYKSTDKSFTASMKRFLGNYNHVYGITDLKQFDYLHLIEVGQVRVPHLNLMKLSVLMEFAKTNPDDFQAMQNQLMHFIFGRYLKIDETKLVPDEIIPSENPKPGDAGPADPLPADPLTAKKEKKHIENY